MTALLEVSNVAVTFGGLRALSDVSLDVTTGAIVGLIGPNGAGKTTLFNVISGLQPAQGMVSFDGRDVSRLAANRRARLGVGRSFQNLGLMREETVLTNLLAAQHLGAGYGAWDLAVRPVRWWRHESILRRRAARVLDELGLSSYADRAVADLSFGVGRFVELAAVLIEAPRLMLLDEPTTGLDVAETERLTGLLVDLRQRGVTVLVVAHDVRFVMALCDDVFVLAEGRNLAHGTPAEVRHNQAVIDAYLGQVA